MSEISSNLETFAGANFPVIVADPPWMYQKNAGSKGPGSGAPGAAESIYSTMTTEAISELPVQAIAANDAHLFMWITNPKMFGGRFTSMTGEQVAKAWGFEFRTLLTWVKTTKSGGVSGSGMGHYFRGATEHVLYATRGKARIAPERREQNVILAPARGHSVKPDEFMELVERVTDGPYLEMFARTARPGWSAFGNEVSPIPATDELLPLDWDTH